MAILVTPMSQEERDQFNEDRWDAKIDQYNSQEYVLSVNNEGTLIIWSHQEEDVYGLIFSVPGNPPTFFEALDELDIEIEEGSQRGFFETWYNGADSTHSTFTLERYREMLKDYSGEPQPG